MINILLRSILNQKKSLLFWVLGIVFLVGLLIAFYPTVRDSAADLQKFIENLPKSIRDTFVGGDIDFGSPTGYLTSRLFSSILPILMLFYAIANGSGAIAGEQEKGTLDTLLSTPTPRWKIVLAKYISLLLGLSFLVTISALVVLIGAFSIEMELESEKLLAMFISLNFLAISFGSLAFFIGAATGNRSLSIGVSVLLAVFTYLIHTLAPAVAFFESIRWVSPFYHYIGENPLQVGLGIDHIVVLKGVSFILLVGSVVAFQRRDIKS